MKTLMKMIGISLATLVMVGGMGCATKPSPAIVLPAHTAARLSFEAGPRASMQLINDGTQDVDLTLHKIDTPRPQRSEISPGEIVLVPLETVWAVEFENRSYDEAVITCKSRGIEHLKVDPIVGIITTPYYAGVTE